MGVQKDGGKRIYTFGFDCVKLVNCFYKRFVQHIRKPKITRL